MPPLDRVCNLAQYLQDRHGNLTIFQHKIYPPGITQPRLRDDFDKISCIPPGRPSEGHGSLSSTGPTPSLTRLSSCPQELARGHQPTPGWYSGVSFS